MEQAGGTGELVREPGRAPPRHAHGDLTSLAPHERLPEILVVPRQRERDCFNIYKRASLGRGEERVEQLLCIFSC